MQREARDLWIGRAFSLIQVFLGLTLPSFDFENAKKKARVSKRDATSITMKNFSSLSWKRVIRSKIILLSGNNRRG
jgi:hypothetical protein